MTRASHVTGSPRACRARLMAARAAWRGRLRAARALIAGGPAAAAAVTVLAGTVLAVVLAGTVLTAGQARPAGRGRAVPAGRDVGSGRAAGTARGPRRAGRPAGWARVSALVAARTDPRPGRGPLPAADRLLPVGTSGPQQRLPITPERWRNAEAIVRQVLAMHMGLRAAVIAVATAMQESGLVNVGYGTSGSLGLFQQQPSMGWGTAAQIMRPSHAAAAFLGALRAYAAGNPGWARQPLWMPAQGVQRSGFPYAYARWEAQAADLVRAITRHLI